MASKKGMSTIVVSIAVITVFATLVAIIMGNRIEGLMTIFNNGADIGTGDIEENNMYGLIKEFLSQGLYQDAKDLSDEFMRKFKESDKLDEVKYLKFYALSNYDMELAFTYAIEVVSGNETAVDNMLKRDYALNEMPAVTGSSMSGSEEVTWNFYEGIKYLISDEKTKAKTSFEKNFKYIDYTYYLNFPLFNLFQYKVDEGILYSFRINDVALISQVGYLKVEGCSDEDVVAKSYSGALKELLEDYDDASDTTPSFTINVRGDLLYLKEMCPKVYESFGEQYKESIELEAETTTDARLFLLMNFMMNFEKDIFDSYVPNCCDHKMHCCDYESLRKIAYGEVVVADDGSLYEAIDYIPTDRPYDYVAPNNPVPDVSSEI